MKLLNEPDTTPAVLEQWEVTVLDHFNKTPHDSSICRACMEWDIAYDVGFSNGVKTANRPPA